VDGFSGGERARLALALIAWGQPNVLLLDEPTNHLDLEMREALAEALSLFEGAIVMVSHDRHLIGLVCETYWRVSDGKVEPFDGDLDEYAAWLRARASAQGGKGGKIESAPLPAAAPAPSAPARKANPHKLAQAEARVAELEAQLSSIDARLADPDTYSDPTRLAQLGREREALLPQLSAAEQAWSSLYDAA
jgi:ATP-binding cassette subfamily F protein 3